MSEDGENKCMLCKKIEKDFEITQIFRWNAKKYETLYCSDCQLIMDCYKILKCKKFNPALMQEVEKIAIKMLGNPARDAG